MPKQPISVTIGQDNLLWLKGRVVGGKRKSISEALDELVTAARRGGHAPSERRSVVGTVDIAADDRLLDDADAYIRSTFEASLARPVLVREERAKKPRRG